MRIELVVDVPGVHNPDAIDAITYGNEVVRLVRNDTGDITASLIHAAVGSDIAVPSDYDSAHPVAVSEPTAIVHDPSAVTPHNENVDSNVTSPSVDGAAVFAELHDVAWDEAHAVKELGDHKDAALAEAYPEDPAADAAVAAVVPEPEVAEVVAEAAAPSVDAAVTTEATIAPPVETPEQVAYDANGTKD